MNNNEIDFFEKSNAQLIALHDEISALSKKSPNDGVNKFKLKLINKLLQDTNTVLDKNHRPFDDFTVFDEDALPTNSDVVFILSQYINCMETLRAKNIGQNDYEPYWYWVIDGETSQTRTAPPKKLKER